MLKACASVLGLLGHTQLRSAAAVATHAVKAVRPPAPTQSFQPSHPPSVLTARWKLRLQQCVPAQCWKFSLETGQRTGIAVLDPSVFGVPIRPDILHRIVLWQLAKKRQPHQAKTRSEVKGTTKKPFPQKGLGRGRQGSWKGPHMRGGGVAFPPRLRSFEFSLNKKVRQLGLKVALSLKQAQSELLLLDGSAISEKKTGWLAKRLEEMDLGRWHRKALETAESTSLALAGAGSTEIDRSKSDVLSLLIVEGPEVNENLRLAVNNLPNVDILPCHGLNVYDILRHRSVAITPAALDYIYAKLAAPGITSAPH
eukprot:TRINITY_DN8383_c0_g1_i2.p1 TRINITY_DN8383_c0_g1~~TRINITY_DN8383_c0_g1_i2.p1  ORF type:complete len:311 (-),score=55.57 TRINITY_DN8383_c0_g1_i2:18-950(-)